MLGPKTEGGGSKCRRAPPVMVRVVWGTVNLSVELWWASEVWWWGSMRAFVVERGVEGCRAWGWSCELCKTANVLIRT